MRLKCFFWCVVHTHITPVMNEKTLFIKGLSLEVTNCFSIKPSALEEKFSFFYFFILNRQRKRKRAENDRPPHRVKGAFCLFVCVFFG